MGLPASGGLGAFGSDDEAEYRHYTGTGGAPGEAAKGGGAIQLKHDALTSRILPCQRRNGRVPYADALYDANPRFRATSFCRRSSVRKVSSFLSGARNRAFARCHRSAPFR